MMHRTVLNLVVLLRHARFKSINPTPMPPTIQQLMIMEVMVMSASYPLVSKDKIRIPTSMKEAGYSRRRRNNNNNRRHHPWSVRLAMSNVRMDTV